MKMYSRDDLMNMQNFGGEDEDEDEDEDDNFPSNLVLETYFTWPEVLGIIYVLHKLMGNFIVGKSFKGERWKKG